MQIGATSQLGLGRSPHRHRPGAACLALFQALASAVVLSTSVAALAADRDQDGVDDAVDALPDDPQGVAQQFVPAEGAYDLFLFEDQWPLASDLDFNDVVVAYHHAVRLDAQGQATGIRITVGIQAAGGTFDNALAIHLPGLARSNIAQAVLHDGSQWSTISAWAGEANAVLSLESDLRRAFGAQTNELVNAEAGAPLRPALIRELEVRFQNPIAWPSGEPDLFVHRAADSSHQIHLPGFFGTQTMNAALFHTGRDASSTARAFVDVDGMPYALGLGGATYYPLEGTDIVRLYPDLALHASSGGLTHADFMDRPAVQHAYPHGVDVLPRPIDFGGGVRPRVRVPSSPDVTCGYGAPAGALTTLRIPFDVSAAARAYQLTLFARDGRDLSLQHIVLPAGTGGPATIELASSAYYGFSQTALMDQWRDLSPEGLAHFTVAVPFDPTRTDDVRAGAHEVVVETMSQDVCVHFVEKRHDGAVLNLRVHVPAISTPTLTLSAALAPRHVGLGQVLFEARQFLVGAGIARGSVEFVPMPANGGLRNITSVNELGALSSSSRAGPDGTRALDVFLVESLFNGLLGRAGDSPGPAVAGTSRSGVAMEVANSAGVPWSDEFNRTDARNLGLVLAHEIGHYLGLRHPRNTPLVDDSACGPTNGVVDLSHNLMCDGLVKLGSQLTAEQRWIIRHHPVLSASPLGTPTTIQSLFDTGSPNCWFSELRGAVVERSNGEVFVPVADQRYCDTRSDRLTVHRLDTAGTWTSARVMQFSYPSDPAWGPWARGIPGGISATRDAADGVHVLVEARVGAATGAVHHAFLGSADTAWTNLGEVVEAASIQRLHGNHSGANYTGVLLDVGFATSANQLQLLAFDGAWWATRYHVLASQASASTTTWPAFSEVDNQIGIVDRGPFQGVSQGYGPTEGLQVWLDKARCVLRGRELHQGVWQAAAHISVLGDADPAFCNYIAFDNYGFQASTQTVYVGDEPHVFIFVRPAGSPTISTTFHLTRTGGVWSRERLPLNLSNSHGHWPKAFVVEGRVKLAGRTADDSAVQVFDPGSGAVIDLITATPGATIRDVDLWQDNPSYIVWSEQTSTSETIVAAPVAWR